MAMSWSLILVLLLLQIRSFNEADVLGECSHPILTDLCDRYDGQGLAAILTFLEGTLFPSMWFRVSAEEALKCELFQ